MRPDQRTDAVTLAEHAVTTAKLLQEARPTSATNKPRYVDGRPQIPLAVQQSIALTDNPANDSAAYNAALVVNLQAAYGEAVGEPSASDYSSHTSRSKRESLVRRDLRNRVLQPLVVQPEHYAMLGCVAKNASDSATAGTDNV